MLRGNGGKKIFFDDEDREHFYWLIHEGIKRYDHQIHGFCLMDNHLHMAIQVGETPLSKIMQNLSFRYTRWIICQRRHSSLAYKSPATYENMMSVH